MSEAKNHHYIPQSYLRKFAHQRGEEFYVYVRYKGEKFFESNVRNICSENYFYTLPDAKDKNRIEKFYADEIDTIFPLLHEIAKDESIKKLDQGTIKKIVRSAISLYLRTPKFLNQYNEHIYALMGQLWDYTLGKSEVHHVNFLGKKLDVRNMDFDQLEQQIIKENKVLFLEGHLKVLDSIVEHKAADGIGINSIVDDSELITSDNPVIIRNYQNGGFNSLFDPDNVIYLPIDRKLMLTIMPDSFGSANNNVLRVLSTKDFTISINDDTEANSERWIIGSEDSLKNHLADQAKYNEHTPENFQWLMDSRKKAELMNEVNEILIKNGGTMTAEVAEKVKDLSQHELLKDDPQIQKALKEIIAQGF